MRRSRSPSPSPPPVGRCSFAGGTVVVAIALGLYLIGISFVAGIGLAERDHRARHVGSVGHPATGHARLRRRQHRSAGTCRARHHGGADGETWWHRWSRCHPASSVGRHSSSRWRRWRCWRCRCCPCDSASTDAGDHAGGLDESQGLRPHLRWLRSGVQRAAARGGGAPRLDPPGQGDPRLAELSAAHDQGRRRGRPADGQRRRRRRGAPGHPRRRRRRTRRTEALVHRLRDEVLPMLRAGRRAHRRRRPHRGGHRPRRQARGRLPYFIGGRDRVELPAADDRVPVGVRALQGGADEPAVDRRRLRRRGRRLPVGVAVRSARHRAAGPIESFAP